jgi:nitroreductase
MTNAVIDCTLSRTADKYHDPSATLSDDQIRELVRIGTTAPTSFHLQNWRFIAVRTPEAKARLSPIAWNQAPITEAAVTFIVVGQLADSSKARSPRRCHSPSSRRLGQREAAVGQDQGRAAHNLFRA